MNSPLEPLRTQRWFRAFWLAALASNIGTWVHEVGAALLMTRFFPTSSDPLMVALVRTAMNVPLVLLALPLGALADHFDRRKFLIVTQLGLLLVALTLAVLTWLQWIGPWRLLGLTFLMGVGAALHGPAWQATLPLLVDRSRQAAAVALGSASWNLARATGPAVGGAVIAAAGIGAAFAFNAVSFLIVLAVLLNWTSPTRATPREPLAIGALTADILRYCRDVRVMRHLLIRTFLFTFVASALWGLIPVVAREHHGWDAIGFGSLMSAIGIGAVLAVIIVQPLREKLSSDGVLMLNAIGFAIGLSLLSLGSSPWLEWPLMIPMGAFWMMTYTTLNGTAQLTLPAPLRARGMAAYLMTFSAGMASGSMLWGAIARFTSLPIGLAAAAVTMLLAAVIGRRYSLGSVLTDSTSVSAPVA
jgi:MFS family permease